MVLKSPSERNAIAFQIEKLPIALHTPEATSDRYERQFRGLKR